MTDPQGPDEADDLPPGPTASGPTLPAEVVGGDAVPVGVDDDEDAPFDLGELLGAGGLDLGNLMEQAAQMQQQMAEAQEAAAETVLEGAAGGGAVRVVVTGVGEFRAVSIDPAAVDPDDVAMLEDLVLAALHDATARIEELRQSSMGGLGDLFGG
jgi:DNA-binding YbaB/EbfC family protein